MGAAGSGSGGVAEDAPLAPGSAREVRLYTAQEAAEVLGVTPPRVRQRAVDGSLPSVVSPGGDKGRRSYRFPADEVDALARAEREAPARRPVRRSRDADGLELALAQGRVRELEAELAEARHRLELQAVASQLELERERARRDAELVRARAELEHHRTRREELEAELAREVARAEARHQELERRLVRQARALLGQLDAQRAQLAQLLDEPG